MSPATVIVPPVNLQQNNVDFFLFRDDSIFHEPSKIARSSTGINLNQILNHYLPRAPRYILIATDMTDLRFAKMGTRGQARSAGLQDVSESGLAFSYSGSSPPKIGDLIKIEFTVPGRKSIACFASVRRCESEDLNHRVAIEFHRLPTAHKRALHLALQGRAIDKDEFEVLELSSRMRHQLTRLTVLATLAAIILLLSLAIFFDFFASL